MKKISELRELLYHETITNSAYLLTEEEHDVYRLHEKKYELLVRKLFSLFYASNMSFYKELLDLVEGKDMKQIQEQLNTLNSEATDYNKGQHFGEFDNKI